MSDSNNCYLMYTILIKTWLFKNFIPLKLLKDYEKQFETILFFSN